MIFNRLLLFQINNHHHACIEKNSRRASKQSEFPARRGFSFETSDTETCDNQKELFDHPQFSFDPRVDDYRPQRVDKRNRPNGDILEFHNRHKIFSYEKIESLAIEKSEHNAQTVKTSVEINQFYEIKTAHIGRQLHFMSTHELQL